MDFYIYLYTSHPYTNYIIKSLQVYTRILFIQALIQRITQSIAQDTIQDLKKGIK